MSILSLVLTVPCVLGFNCDDQGALSLCSHGTYCPTPSERLVCPKGSWCPSGSVHPFPCKPLGLCPEGATDERWFLLPVLLLIACLVAYLANKVAVRRRLRKVCL